MVWVGTCMVLYMCGVGEYMYGVGECVWCMKPSLVDWLI